MRKMIDTKAACIALGGISDDTLKRWWRAGIVPPPLRLGRRHQWFEDEIMALHDRLEADRDALAKADTDTGAVE